MNAKEDIVKYVTTTPHNINPMILNQKLDEFSAGSSGNNSDAVKYVEQILTNEEKMQARKNLGLHYMEGSPKQIGVYVGALNLEKLPIASRLLTEVAGYYFETEQQKSSFSIPMAGEDYIRWYGNGNLIPPKAISQNIEMKQEKIYPNLPYVVYYSIAELGSVEEGVGIAFDEEVLAEMGIDIHYHGFYFYDLNDLEYYYETIPQEYLPPVIVKDRNGNNYHLVVNDDGSLSVEPA